MEIYYTFCLDFTRLFVPLATPKVLPLKNAKEKYSFILSFCILLVYSYLCSKSKDDMNQTPLVSFIITYYNLPVDMLHECIGSIMQLPLQSEEREIILIDDGSDITPLNEIIDYRDEVIYLRQHNQGLSTARNVGVDISKGRYIQFIDADDCLIKGGYEHCLSILRKESPDMVIFNFTREGTDVDTLRLCVQQEDLRRAAVHAPVAA